MSDTEKAPEVETATQSEVEQLRRRVVELESQLAEATVPIQRAAVGEPGAVAPRRRGHDWWRAPVVVLLLVITTVCAPLSIVARWTHGQIGDTDTYVSTVAPLASDPAVQAQVTETVTDAIFSRLDVQAITQQAVAALQQQGLPPNVATGLDALSGPLANGVQNFVHDQVAKLVASDAFQNAWVAANRQAHAELVAVLTGEQGQTLRVEGNTVSINLATLIDTVKSELSSRGFGLVDRLPTVNAEFVVLQSADIGKAQRVFSLLDTLATALPIIGLLCLLLAVWISRHHRRTLMIGALCIAGSMLLLGAALNLARPYYLDALPTTISPAAGGAVFDTITQTIRVMLRSLLAIALVVAVFAWASGSSTAAVTMRAGLARAATSVREGGARHGITAGPVGTFVGRYRTPLRILVLALGALVYVAADRPSAGFIITLAVVVVVLIGLIELLASPAPHEPAPPAPPGAPASV